MSNWTLKNQERKLKGGSNLPPAKKSSGKQIALTLLLCAIVLSTFMMVFAVDYYYTTLNGTSQEVSLFKSDIDTEYPTTDYISTYTGNRYYDSQTGQRIGKGADWIQFNRTPAYLGNDTWSANINGTGAMLPYGWQYFSIQNSLFNVDEWVLTKIVVNITLNADTDLRIASSIDSMNTYTDPTDFTQSNLLFHDTTVSGVTYYNKSYIIPLSTALSIYDIAQERTDYVLFTNIYDKNADGFSAWACQWEIELFGRKVSGWSEQTTLALVLFAGTSFNLIGGWFALDQNDWGRDVKDIPPKRKPKSKTKSKRRSK